MNREPSTKKLKPGDIVRHIKDKDIGKGVVKEIAKSGVRARVDFGEIPDWDKKKLVWAPYPAYYRIDLLALEASHETET